MRIGRSVSKRLLSLCSSGHLWLSNLSYIRLLREFIYLAVILDAFSRHVIGWSLARQGGNPGISLTLAALDMALKSRTVTAGLIHHSDQGVQKAAQAYVNLLEAHGITISMSRTGNPFDNAMAESFIKTLKYEEVLLNEYETLEEALGQIEHFIEEVYNSKRLHSSLGYRPPVEYEQMVLKESHMHQSLAEPESVST